MTNRRLSGEEIALIKAMIAEGMPAQNICGYMFRPDRSLNPAGVYEIKSGRFGSDVPAASPEALARWIKEHPYFGAVSDADDIARLRKELRGILRFSEKHGDIVVEPAETFRIEFKEEFHFAVIAEYCKSLIGYANHSGGYIVFGIKDNRQVVGLASDRFRKFDQQRLSEQFKDIGLDSSSVVDVTTGEIAVAPADAGGDGHSLAARVVVKKAGISDLDILNDFINQVETIDAVAYLRQMAHEAVRWLPLFYYVHMSGLSPSAAYDEVKGLSTSKPGTVKHIRERLEGKISAYRSYIGKAPKMMLKRLQEGELPDLSTLADARHFSSSLQNMSEGTSMRPSLMRTALRRMLESFHEHGRDAAIGSNMRRSAARVDEVLHRPGA